MVCADWLLVTRAIVDATPIFVQLLVLRIEFYFLFQKERKAIFSRPKKIGLICHFFFPLTESNEEEGGEFPQPRRFFHRICTHGYFDLGISAVIVLNVICMAMEHYNQPEVRNLLLSNLVFYSLVHFDTTTCTCTWLTVSCFFLGGVGAGGRGRIV